MAFHPDQLRRGYRRNAEAYRRMVVRARQAGGTLNGYTVEQLQETADEYAYIATLPDRSLADHAERAQRAAVARLMAIRAGGRA